MKTDKQIRQDVLDELRWDPAANAADGGVTDLVHSLVASYPASMPLQNATVANAAPSSADRGADGGDRRLMWHGMFLFLLGLVTGLLEQRFTNVRMGLSAHLEGVMNGILLVALGAIWSEVRLLAKAKRIAYWTALLGTYLNWLVTTLGAVFGTAADSPISAAGHSGRAWQETLVSAGFLLVSISIIASSVLILWGLRTRALRAASYG